MITGIYIRVSTEEQAKEGYSIKAQEEKLKDYVRIKGWELYKVYADEGISGKNITERPAINEMLRDLISKKIDNVLVFKIDRLTRSTKDLIELIDIFNKNDCAFNSLMESIDTSTPSGRMFIKIIGIFAEFERENLIERISVALEKKVKEGYSLCSTCPSYGYDRPNGEKVQIVNKNETKIVREIFNMYVNKNMTRYAIAKELNMKHVPTKLKSNWNSATISAILTNPNYVGKVRYATNDEKRYFESDGKHEAIISEELFDNAQIKLTKLQKKAIKKWPKEDNYYCGT